MTEREYTELAIIYSLLNKAIEENNMDKVKEAMPKLKILMAKVSPKLINPFAEYSFTPNKS